VAFRRVFFADVLHFGLRKEWSHHVGNPCRVLCEFSFSASRIYAISIGNAGKVQTLEDMGNLAMIEAIDGKILHHVRVTIC